MRSIAVSTRKPSASPAAHAQIVYGSINTVILLTSSFTMTVALRAATANVRRVTLIFLGITAALGIAFLVCKGLEYREDLKEHLFPGPQFPLSPPATAMFWGFYWIMTGIHAVHLTAGIAIVLVVWTLFKRHVIPVQGSTMEGVAIYWHFVEFGLDRALSPALSRRPLMTDGRQDRRYLWLGPGVAWLALLVLFAASLGSAYLPLGTGNVAINLAIAAVMLAVLATFLMDLRNSVALVRIVAAAGLFWIVIMFALTFSDFLTRHY